MFRPPFPPLDSPNQGKSHPSGGTTQILGLAGGLTPRLTQMTGPGGVCL